MQVAHHSFASVAYLEAVTVNSFLATNAFAGSGFAQVNFEFFLSRKMLKLLVKGEKKKNHKSQIFPKQRTLWLLLSYTESFEHATVM